MSDNKVTEEAPVTTPDDIVVLHEASSPSGRRLARWSPPVAAVVISTLFATVALRLWHMHAGVPLEYGGDSLAHAMHLQQITQHGWYWSDARLGAPFTQHFQDWPLPDVTSLVTAWTLALATNNWAVIANGMFLLSFPLVALSGWWAARKIGVSPWMSVVVGVIYSILPYHHVRGEQHLFLSNYYVVPLAIVLAVRTISGEALFRSTRRYRTRLFRFASWQTVQTIALCAVVGLGGVYYAAFALLFVGTALIVRLIQTKKLRAVVPGVLVAGFIVAFVLVATSPTILYHQTHGANGASIDRNATDTDVYGLKLAQMLAPVPGHRVAALDDLQNRYLGTFPIPGERGSPALGVIAGIGLLYLLVLTALSLVRAAPVTAAAKRRGQLALFSLVGLVVAMVGGLSTFVSLLLSSEIRSWNRMSIFIGFFALAAVALLLDGALKRMTPGKVRVALPVVAATLLVVGFLDQTNDSWVPDYTGVDAAFLSDQTYFHTIDSTLPAGASVFELPQLPFPEAAPVASIGSYDLLKPYLHTSKTHWSFAGVKGRVESEWQDRLAGVAPTQLPEDLAAAGFSGLYIDRTGYVDHAAAIESQLQSVLNERPLVDSTGNKAFYDLRNYSALEQKQDAQQFQSLKTDLTFPVAVVGAKKLFAEESDATHRWMWADGTSGTLLIENSTSTARSGQAAFTLQTATADLANFTITWPDGSKQSVVAGLAGTPVTKTITFPPGDTEIHVETNAARLTNTSDSRDLHFQLINPDVNP